MQHLSYTVNPYGAAVVDALTLLPEPEPFALRLAASLERWRREGLVFVWLELGPEQAPLIPVAVAAGFGFHHAENGYLVLGYRLEPGAEVLEPASHYVGVGGAVLSDALELLVVRERLRRDGRPQPYKLPGGYVRAGEHLSEAALREVREETGVRARFVSLACVRLWHAKRFGASDLYFVCRLRPETFEITPQESEIAEARWMPLEEFLRRDDVHAFNKGVVRQALASRGWRTGWFEGYDADPAERELFFEA